MKKMTSRERAIAAIKHITPDRVPLDMTICEKPYIDLLDYFGIDKSNISEPDKWGEILMIPELAKALGIDFLFIKPGKNKKTWQKIKLKKLKQSINYFIVFNLNPR